MTIRRVEVKKAPTGGNLHPKFYEFRQNNSGGRFTVDESRGISVRVIIEGINYLGANVKAQEIGLYFDGQGDCSCCGDRWYEVDDYSIIDLDKYDGGYAADWVDPGCAFAYIHYLDGSIVGLVKE